MSKLSHRFLVLSFSVLFIVSTVILLIDSTATIPAPAWSGYLDVGIVVLIALAVFAIYRGSKSVPRASYQIALYPLPILLVAMWIYRNVLAFNILLPGVAWRTFLFLSLLPHALDTWKMEGRL
jgi:hypothetical protein